MASIREGKPTQSTYVMLVLSVAVSFAAPVISTLSISLVRLPLPSGPCGYAVTRADVHWRGAAYS
ncbi:MAG: hypothetical protein U0165_11065 [Polyangiaceae bacterium]